MLSRLLFLYQIQVGTAVCGEVVDSPLQSIRERFTDRARSHIAQLSGLEDQLEGMTEEVIRPDAVRGRESIRTVGGGKGGAWKYFPSHQVPRLDLGEREKTNTRKS